jgi:rare lipoprotein A
MAERRSVVTARRWSVWAALALAILAAGGCARRVAAPTPGVPQTGIASWYGPGFHGRATSSGEIYDQYALTAAHPSLPLGTRARVTNLENGRSIEVRVNDRGPFAKGRAIDLSHGAARAIGMLGPGTAPVRIEVVERAPGGYSRVLYSVQVGAFREEARARALRANLAARYGDVYISAVRTRRDRLYRVRVGPYAERRAAERRALDLADLGFPAAVREEPRP